MTRRKKTDGERIAADIERLIRRRMAEAWEDGWFDRDCQELDWHENPYRGRRRASRGDILARKALEAKP